MANILEYIKWRGDLKLTESSFNEIDNLILSRFSYLPFDRIIKENEIVTINELNKRFQNQNLEDMKILWEDDIKLFPAMGNSERFGNMKVTTYINKIEADAEEQFSAISIIMPDDTIYISYRGTDNTLVGWKEDFNMSFKSHTASQIDAIKYLEKIASTYSYNIRLGGHSKGGNLAVYAAVFTSKEIKKRIVNIYNNDGPGFRDDIIEMQEYKDIIPKVRSFIPQSSIVGRLLKHQEETTIVQSTQKGIMQHDLYSWQLMGKQFIHLKELSNDSELIDKTIKAWLDNVENEKRELVIDVLFEILNKTEVETLAELKTNLFTNARIIMQSYKKVDNETKEIIMQTLQVLASVVKSNIKEKTMRRDIKDDRKFFSLLQ